MQQDEILRKLIDLSNELGEESHQFLIMGEGNTSASCGDGTFWVKASGYRLGQVGVEGFSRVSIDPIMKMLERPTLTDDEISEGFTIALVDPAHKRPSIETFLHAIFIQETGAQWVGHTHPISVLSILCSAAGAEPFLRNLFPEQILICGVAPMVVPYADPGLPLAQAVRDSLDRYMDQYERAPHTVLMLNHGLIAIGESPRQVFNITQMVDKWARILLGNSAFGGPQYLSDENTARIDTRKDDKDRLRLMNK